MRTYLRKLGSVNEFSLKPQYRCSRRLRLFKSLIFKRSLRRTYEFFGFLNDENSIHVSDSLDGNTSARYVLRMHEHR